MPDHPADARPAALVTGLKVLFAASEAQPLVKTGGLADVVGALPRALGSLGHDVKVLLPAYPGVLDRLRGRTRHSNLTDLFGGPARVEAGRADSGLHVLAIDAPHLYAKPTADPYGPTPGVEWDDNHLRFAALGWVASAIGRGTAGAWTPDIVHAHDWQAGLAPAYLALAEETRPRTVVTIHNLAFQGLFDRTHLGKLRLPEQAFAVEGVEFHGQIGFLKAALHYADRITTVSPTYAREIQTPEFGAGLDGLLRHRAAVLDGILNGIDHEEWNPESDRHLPEMYGAHSLAKKAANKAALQESLGLAAEPRAPLFAVISRLTQQKGLDLLLAALPTLRASGAQLAVLGSGDAELVAGFTTAAKTAPEQVAFRSGWDEALSHRFQGGADFLVVPSRFEPCGLTQLCGLRYGTIPVVARVGGLADTIIDANEAALADGVATGFQFAPQSIDALQQALLRAAALYTQRDAWSQMQARAMSRDFGWERSAQRYATLYEGLLARP